MAAASNVPPGEYMSTADERIVMYGAPWARHEAQLAPRGDASVPRIAYLDGAMELLRPSRQHERVNSHIGRLVEKFALVREIDLSPRGAWTLREPCAASSSGVEAVGHAARPAPARVAALVVAAGIAALAVRQRRRRAAMARLGP